MSDRARRTILERRAAFVAAAIASLGAAGGCDNSARACLSATADPEARPVTPPDASIPLAEPEVGAQPCLSEMPMPCLSPPPLPVDGGPRPVPCLSIAMPRDAGSTPPSPPKPKPKPCLSVVPTD